MLCSFRHGSGAVLVFLYCVYPEGQKKEKYISAGKPTLIFAEYSGVFFCVTMQPPSRRSIAAERSGHQNKPLCWLIAVLLCCLSFTKRSHFSRPVHWSGQNSRVASNSRVGSKLTGRVNSRVGSGRVTDDPTREVLKTS